MDNDIKLVIEKGTKPWKDLFHSSTETDFETLRADMPDIETLGDTSLLLDPAHPKILIAGNLEPDRYEEEVLSALILSLSANPVKPVIVSGFAPGIQTMAHKAALEHGLPTVAVLASPLRGIYPRQNEALARSIAEEKGCALLTQFTRETKASPTTIIGSMKTAVLLSQAAILTGAREKSNAAMCARMAYLTGRRVLAAPGRINDTNMAGSNRFIADWTAEMLTQKVIEDLQSFNPTIRRH